MALDSVQIKYLEGEGSPNGVVKGKKGFTYKDTVTGDEYDSLGGDKWRIINYQGSELVERTLNLSEFTQELSNLSKNEIVFLKDRNAKYINTDTKQQKSARLSGTSSNDLVRFLNSSYPNTLNYFVEGDSFTLKIKINKEGVKGGRGFELLSFPGDSLNIQYINGFNTITTYSTLYSIEVRNDKGLLIENNRVVENNWYYIKVTLTAPLYRLNTGIGINYTFRNADWEVDFASIKIESEKGGIDLYEFKYYKNNTLYNQDETKSFNLVNVSYPPTIHDVPLLPDELLTQDGNILKLIVEEGVIRPQNLGYNTVLNRDLNFNNDVSDILQFCFDSDYNVEIPAGNYYVGKTIHITGQKYIKMFGNHKRLDSDNTSTTAFYTDKNIEVFRVSGTNIIIDGAGVIFFDLVPDIENPIGWSIGARDTGLPFTGNIRIDKLSVHGNQRKLQQGEDIGGYGIRINTDLEEDISGRLFEINGIYLTDIDIEGVNIACYAPPFSRAYLGTSERGWFNTVHIKGRITNCKQGLVLQSGGAYYLDIMGQDNPVLLESERDKYYHVLDANAVTFDIYTADTGERRDSDPEHYYRHMNHIWSENPNNIAINTSMINWELERTKANNSNKNTVVRDPNFLAITGKVGNATQLNNQVGMAGWDDTYSYKGYVEPLNVEHVPQDNAASDANINSIGSFEQGTIGGNVNIESLVKSESSPADYFIRVKSTSEASGYAQLEITGLTPNSTYNLSFESRGSGALQRFQTENLVKEVSELYTSKEWKKRKYEIKPNGTSIILKFFSHVGITSVYTDVKDVRWKDRFIRGNDYIITVTDGVTTYSVNYTPDKYFPPTRTVGGFGFEDAGNLTALFRELPTSPDIKVKSHTEDGLLFEVESVFGADTPVTVTTELVGEVNNYMDVNNLKLEYDWSKNNLHPSTSILNDVVLTEEIDETNVSIYSERFLKTLNADARNSHTINNPKGFVEIIVPIQTKGSKLRRVVANFSQGAPIKTQVIFYDMNNEQAGASFFNTEVERSTTIDLVPRVFEAINFISTHVILRLFGIKYNPKDTNNKMVSIRDLIVTSSNNEYTPVLTTIGGSIKNKGQLISSVPISDNARIFDTSVYFEFSTDIELFDFRKFKPTIVLNNTSGSQKNFKFDTYGNAVGSFLEKDGSLSGAEYTIFCAKNEEPYKTTPSLSTSSDIYIENSFTGIYTLDKAPLTLKAGEWIKVKLIKYSEFNTNSYKFIELSRSNPQSYKFFEKTKRINDGSNIIIPFVTEDTGTVIDLSSSGGNLCNATDANTSSVFTTTKNTLNAFAEVRIKRSTQPTITGATYRQNKGTAFLPNTDMIMHVEYKGTVRGVEYWFENFSPDTVNNLVDKSATQSLTGTELDLSDNVKGIIYNQETPSTSNEFTTKDLKRGGYVVNYISTVDKIAFPTVTGVTSTNTAGDKFRAGATFKMIVESDGTDVEYFFVDYLNTTPEVIEAKDIDFSTLPTSDVGLASGKLWNNSGVLQIVP